MEKSRKNHYSLRDKQTLLSAGSFQRNIIKFCALCPTSLTAMGFQKPRAQRRQMLQTMQQYIAVPSKGEGSVSVDCHISGNFYRKCKICCPLFRLLGLGMATYGLLLDMTSLFVVTETMETRYKTRKFQKRKWVQKRTNELPEVKTWSTYSDARG